MSFVVWDLLLIYSRFIPFSISKNFVGVLAGPTLRMILQAWSRWILNACQPLNDFIHLSATSTNTGMHKEADDTALTHVFLRISCRSAEAGFFSLCLWCRRQQYVVPAFFMSSVRLSTEYFFFRLQFDCHHGRLIFSSGNSVTPTDLCSLAKTIRVIRLAKNWYPKWTWTTFSSGSKAFWSARAWSLTSPCSLIKLKNASSSNRPRSPASRRNQGELDFGLFFFLKLWTFLSFFFSSDFLSIISIFLTTSFPINSFPFHSIPFHSFPILILFNFFPL